MREQIIYAYTRAQALEDGVLTDITKLAQEAGFKFPVAVTQGVMAILQPSAELEAYGQSFDGRAWDMLTILRHAIRGMDGDTVFFSPLFIRRSGGKPTAVEMWAKCGPGDNGEPVITIMLRGED